MEGWEAQGGEPPKQGGKGRLAPCRFIKSTMCLAYSEGLRGPEALMQASDVCLLGVGAPGGPGSGQQANA